ncbi:tumor necrosis factor receptor superfamily member 18 isoform X1 [Brachyistius frenatus]|uniref:tumor necrosis factor receptor superfamily member 18 isoform X1 n=1 Tax=Brachyistius frenatus TaxID=100188 RepID=UPI0037E8D8FE
MDGAVTCVIQVLIWKTSALKVRKLSANPVRRAISQLKTTTLTDVRNASHAIKVRPRIMIIDSEKVLPLTSGKTLGRDVEKRHNIVMIWKSCGLNSCLSTEYDQKCTLTSNAICACRAGFLCSNNICSICEENKCITGEKVKRTAVNSSVVGLVQYSYQCEPLCPRNAYFDANKDICKPWTQCSAVGLAERFPGNKTHDSICDIPELHRDDRVHVILGIGFVLFSLTILLFLCYTCVKKLRKHTENNDPIHVVSTDTYDVHLSKEESGLNLIILNESKDSSF